MKKRYIPILVLFIVLSCTQQQDKKQKDTHAPQLVEVTKGYVFPKDSTLPPKTKPELANNPEDIPAGKPIAVPVNVNVFPAKEPRTIIFEAPAVYTPGQNSFLMPEIITAKDSPYAAGVPEVVVAKDATAKDQNSQNFSSFGILQGLKDNAISSILEDSYGNLWIGYSYNGVTKYDGKNFTFFGAKQGFTGSARCSLEDKAGNLWFAGYQVTKYDGKSLTTFGDKEGFSEESVNSMAEDNSGNIWFGTNGEGAIKYDGKEFTHFSTMQGLVDSFVQSITMDRTGNLWFGTAFGISKYDGKSFTNFKIKGHEELSITCSWEDREGNIWFGSATHGALKYDGKSFSAYTRAAGLASDDVRNILQDKAGNIWFTSNTDGITKFDGENFIHFSDKEGLPSNSVAGIAEDRYGNLWFGTSTSGLCKYNGRQFTHFSEKEGLKIGEGVYNVFEDKAGNLWFGTGGSGVFKYDGKTLSNFALQEGLAINVISAAQDRSGNIWFGTTRGFVKFDGKKFRHYTDTDGLFNGFVFGMLEDKRGNMWFGTAGGGVSKFDGKYFTKYNYPDQGIADNFIRCILEDKAGNIWFGTNWGVSHYDGKIFTNFSKDEGFIDNAVMSMCEDWSGNIWFATRGGVSMYDGKYFLNFTEKEGLPSNYTESILADRSGNIWIGSRLGLSELTKDKLTIYAQKVKTNSLDEGDVFFKNYGYFDGFLGMGVISNSLFEDRNGNIWVGANDRLTAWHPDPLGDIPDTNAINTQVTGIRLFNEDIPWVTLLQPGSKAKDTSFQLGNSIKISKFAFDSLSRWYYLPDHLSLAYNNNFLTFNFIGITLNQPLNVKYKYKLEGIDESWSALTSSTEAPYGNLPAGNYTFKVKAMNSEGYWGKEFSYGFEIRPPWWETWWAYTLYALAFITALWAFIRWRLNALRKGKIFLEEKIKMQQSLMNERLRISRELHDEVGATLSGIAMYSHLTKEQIKNTNTAEVERSLNIMQQSAGEMVNKLNDIVWLVNPDQDSLQKLIQRLEEYAIDMAAIKSMQVKINVPVNLHEQSLPVESRRNVYLFCKEAINNAVKYSNGTLLELNINQTGDKLEFSVSDNGKGFDAVMVRRGNGLENMQKRADEIGAQLTVQSKQHEGALVSMQIKITQ
ncbi:MAG TPA: two-component regulator propeller domain-containing protein [Panacibacter sp.]|nr:two-component regulator propeller domain-containing protein [Panacibacter sp.]